MKNLVINDKGVFEQETRQLSVQALAVRKREAQNRITLFRGRIQDAELEIQRWKAEIASEEKNLETLNGPVIASYIQKEMERKAEIERKAQAILKDCIGEEYYQKLQEQKKIVFTAKDDMTYKIEANGRVYRRILSENGEKKDWKLLCIIRPQSLPLPDFLLSMFVNIKANPQKYPLKRRWR